MSEEADEMTCSSGVQYGLACAQGPRDTMEDEVSIVQDGPRGALFAGETFITERCFSELSRTRKAHELF